MNKAQLLAKTKEELLETAQRLGLRGISTLRKPELVERIYEAQVLRSGPKTRQPLGVAAAIKKVVADVKRRAIRKRATADEPSPASRPAKVAKPKEKRPDIAPVAVEEFTAHKFD